MCAGVCIRRIIFLTGASNNHNDSFPFVLSFASFCALQGDYKGGGGYHGSTLTIFPIPRLKHRVPVRAVQVIVVTDLISETELEVLIKIWPEFSAKATVQNVSVSVPLPSDAVGAVPIQDQGRASEIFDFQASGPQAHWVLSEVLAQEERVLRCAFRWDRLRACVHVAACREPMAQRRDGHWRVVQPSG